MTAILTLNAGSSSVKFAVYHLAEEPVAIASGQVEPVGSAASLTMKIGTEKTKRPVDAIDHDRAIRHILEAIRPMLDDAKVAGIGHRVVHGGPDFSTPLVVSPERISDIEALAPLAPLHQPYNVAAIRAAQAAFPGTPQVACFDTAFHRGQSWVNDTYALPRRYYDEGVRRYGFHGLSYDFIAGDLKARFPDLAAGRVIAAHLGNGASLCAIRDGRSVASTMGFSAIDGLAMGTRSGQIDPGVLLYLMDRNGMDSSAISDLLYRHSGLKGLSGFSGDMRTLLASDDSRAAQAIEFYVYRIQREIGSLAAALGGLDGLVFTGGVGENAAPIRRLVADGLGFLGLAVDPVSNREPAEQIGTSAVRVLVIPTDEERVIARAVVAAL